MAGTFTLASADTSKAAVRSALVDKIEIRKSGEDASQWQELGRIVDGEITFKPGVVEASGGIPIETKLVGVEWKATVLASSTAMRVALNLIHDNNVDARITNRLGDTFTLLATDGCDVALEAEEHKGNSANDPRKMNLMGKGTITKAVYASSYTQAT